MLTAPDVGNSAQYCYALSVELYNHAGRSNLGHPGVLYNAVDENNFDVVYFRYISD